MIDKYEMLLSPVKVGGTYLKNRIINSPHSIHFVQGPETYPSTESILFYADKAKNGCALVNVANVNTTDEGTWLRYWNLMQRDVQVYLGQISDIIHSYGSKVDCFLRYGIYDMFPGKEISDITFYGYIPPNVQPATEEEIEAFADDFSEKCVMLSKLCGMDGVFLHMAYRASTFARALSPLTNNREDKFGGSLEKRCALPLLVADLVREKCGPSFIIEASISADEEGSGGNTEDDLIEIVKLLDGHFDILTLKAPHIDPAHCTQFQDREPYVYLAEKGKKVAKKTLISCSGGLYNPIENERFLEEGKLDLISTARAWLADPNFGTKIYEGKEDEIVPCLRCNKCHVASEVSVHTPFCSVNPRIGWDQRLDTLLDDKPAKLKKVAVIGGGPAGMEAAITAAERGHDVTLYEKTAELGGLLKVTRDVSFKYPLQDFRKYLIHMIGKKNVNICLGCAPTVEQLNAKNYDVIIAAVGSESVVPQIAGIDGKNVITAVDAFEDPSLTGKKVVVIGGGEIGTQCAMYLAENREKDITVIEMKNRLADDATPIHYYSVFEGRWNAMKNFHSLVKSTCTSISPEGVTYRDADGEEHFIEADTVVISAGMKAKQDEALDYAKANGKFYMAGDCDNVSNVRNALRLGYSIAMSL